MSGRNAVSNGILGGWQLQAIYVYQTGSPITWGTSNMLFTGNFAAITGGERSIGRWFHADAGFYMDMATSPNTTYQLRSWPLRFSNIRQDSINNWDLSVIKNVRIHESQRVQFRAEFLNALNHAGFRAPATNPYARDFGQVTGTQGYARIVQIGAKFLF